MKNAMIKSWLFLATAPVWVVEPFCCPHSYHYVNNIIKKKENDMVLHGHHSDCCDCCNSTDSSNANELLVELLSIPIHASRRKFINLATGTAVAGMASVSLSPANAANEVTVGSNDGKSVLSSDNKIFVPGPQIPFSTTRTYRNIVLSNGLKVVLVKDTMAQRSSVALSIDGAGQFAEPPEIPGLAHLMEHIVLSSTRARHGKNQQVLNRKARRLWHNGNNRNAKSRIREEEIISNNYINGEEDFEDWITDNDGDSNAFTAPGFVCFHFNGPHEILPEGLERFSRLFTLDEVESTITQKPFVVPREIGRVADELDRTSDASRAFYFLKNTVHNAEHPFARFSAGSKTTLQTIPAEKGIDVPSELLHFFHDHYLASKATLVVVGKDDVTALDRWISPFSNVMAQRPKFSDRITDELSLSDPMISQSTASNPTQSIILRSKDDMQIDENYQTLCMEWPLSMIYPASVFGSHQAPMESIVTAPAIGFVLTQILSRRGPGSLRLFLEKFGWVPSNVYSKGVPKFSFPVDVSGFQVLRMEIPGLTLDGFANRSAVVSAVFESIRKVIEMPLQLDLIKQYLAAGLLHGYMFAPRPPDAITLAVDSLRFGTVGDTGGIGKSGSNWYLMPNPEDELGVEKMRQLVTDTLRTMSNDRIPLVSFRASAKAIFSSSGGIVDQSISTPPLFSPWKVEPITGARYFVENRANGASSYFRSLSWFALTFDGEELSRPYLNPLLPTKFRAPRPVLKRQSSSYWEGSRSFYMEEASANTGPSPSKLTASALDTWREFRTRPEGDGSNWKMFQIPPSKIGFGLPLPVRPPEPSVESAFVIQLLSSLPSTYTSSQLALANLWLLSFDDVVIDLAELGATAGIAYETSMNTAGLRISFRGVSQTLPSYIRRFCRRLVKHHERLLDGSKIPPSVYERAISEANRSPKINKVQKQQVVDATKQASEKQVAKQGLVFLRCTNGGYLISQGDVLPFESAKLLSELQYIFRDFGNADGFAVEPQIRDILYRPFWRPRDASPCLLPGISLISDCCGRVPR